MCDVVRFHPTNKLVGFPAHDFIKKQCKLFHIIESHKVYKYNYIKSIMRKGLVK